MLWPLLRAVFFDPTASRPVDAICLGVRVTMRPLVRCFRFAGAFAHYVRSVRARFLRARDVGSRLVCERLARRFVDRRGHRAAMCDIFAPDERRIRDRVRVLTMSPEQLLNSMISGRGVARALNDADQ